MGKNNEHFHICPRVAGRNVTAAFDAGSVSANGGIFTLWQAAKRLRIAEILAAAIGEKRDARRVTHTWRDMILRRILLIGGGYPDANDSDKLRHDPAYRMCHGEAPFEGGDAASQSTISRAENSCTLRDVYRMLMRLVDLYCRNAYRKAPKSVTIDLDDSFHETHGGQQMSLFDKFNDGHGYKPLYFCDVKAKAVIGVLLRPATTMSGVELRRYLRIMVARIRRHWPNTEIVFRGDSHFSRAEAMAWCDEQEGVRYIFGFAKNCRIAEVKEVEDAVAKAKRECGRKLGDASRRHVEFLYQAGSWDEPRRVVCRIHCSRRQVPKTGKLVTSADCRFVVTSLEGSTERKLYELDYCMRGQAENLIKLFKSQLHGDRLSCTSALANQFRLVLHAAAYNLLWLARAASGLGVNFDTFQRDMIRIGAQVRSTATRIHVAFSSTFPRQHLFRKTLERLRSAKFIDPAAHPTAFV